MINSHHLRVFEAIAREGSIGGAAHLLGLTQPTVSHHLSALERQLDATLCVRGRRGVELTDRGQALLEHAEMILAQLAAAERAVEDRRDLRDGELRVGSFATAGTTFLPRALRDFHREHPGVRLSVLEIEDPTGIIEHVRARRLDVGVVFTTPDHWVRPVPGLAIQHLFDDPFLLAVPADHPFAERTAVALRELAAERWVTARGESDPCAALLHRACRAADFEPDVAFRIDDYAMVGSCVAAGLGVGIVPRLAVPRLPDGVVTVEIAGDVLVREVHAVALGDGSSVPATAFVRRLRAVAPTRR
ncbi:LysR family transcriptional regulator, partial [Patulibacter sp. S7RM1-6]